MRLGDRVSECPLTLLTGKFLLTYREKRGKEKKENGERRKIKKREKGRWKCWKCKEENFENMERTFLFFFFFFFSFHFSKPLKFVLSLPKWEFSSGKKHFTPGKKIRKKWLPPLKNIPLTPLIVAKKVPEYLLSSVDSMRTHLPYESISFWFTLDLHYHRASAIMLLAPVYLKLSGTEEELQIEVFSHLPGMCSDCK